MCKDINDQEIKKREDLKEEFKIIQKNISRWDKYSLSIKNWAITVWFFMTIFIFTQYLSLESDQINLLPFFVIFFMIPIPFWGFDALFKKFQRISIARSNAIQDYLCEKLKDNEFKKKFPLYDPVGRISGRNEFYKKEYLKFSRLWRCILVRIVSSIYLLLYIISFVILSIVLLNYWFLIGSIIISIILCIIWYYCDQWKI